MQLNSSDIINGAIIHCYMYMLLLLNAFPYALIGDLIYTIVFYFEGKFD